LALTIISEGGLGILERLALKNGAREQFTLIFRIFYIRNNFSLTPIIFVNASIIPLTPTLSRRERGLNEVAGVATIGEVG